LTILLSARIFICDLLQILEGANGIILGFFQKCRSNEISGDGIPSDPGNADSLSDDVVCCSCRQSEFHSILMKGKIKSQSVFNFLLLINKSKKNRKSELQE